MRRRRSLPVSKRILVVEDNDVNYSLVAFILGKQGLQVRRAATGEEALRQAAEDEPDLILMDIQLPGIDGLEVTRRLRARPATRAIPIVALTAFAMVGDDERALAAGCDGYIAKPVSPRILLDTVQRFLGGAAEEHGAA